MQNEKNRKTKIIALTLIFLLFASIGFIATYYQEAQTVTSQLSEAEWQNLIMNFTIQQIVATAPYTTFNLTYTPSMPIQEAYSNTVTFLFGYIEASELQELYYPSAMIMSFKVTHKTNGTAKVSYRYTPMQSVQLVKGITAVYVPFGIFPLTITNAKANEIITFYITINAIVNWTPVNVIIASQNITATAYLQVISQNYATPEPTESIIEEGE